MEQSTPPSDAPARPWLNRRQIITQSIGFIIGLALLIWCIYGAIQNADWSRVRAADPWLIAGLAGCSVVSLVVNGAIFWLTVKPLKPLRFDHMQWLNLVTSVLNYAPLRLGLVARIAYHVRVDRLKVIQIGGWFTAIALTLLTALGACIIATVLRPTFDLIWAGLVLGMVIAGGLALRTIVGSPTVGRLVPGMDVMLRDPKLLWGALALRLVDIAAFAGRMACAVAIIDLSLSGGDIMLLGLGALALSLNPLGRVGFREAGVAIIASMLAADTLTPETLDAQMQQLALIESAGEAMVAVPGGALALLWYRRRWRNRDQG